MKFGYLALMICFLGVSSLFLVNCGSSSSPTSGGGSATATPTSGTSGSQLYAFVLTVNGSGGVSMVAISGPYSNSASSSFSFSLPALSAGVSYVVCGLFDTAGTITIPSGSQIITPPASDYGQQYPNLCISTNSGRTLYTASQSGLNLSMSTANNACVFGSGQSVQYSPATGSAVVLAGTISQTGL